MTGSYLDHGQVEQLLRGIKPERVTRKDGQSHLEAYDVRAHLNRCFGFARWSSEVTDSSLLFEDVHEVENKGIRVWVGYRCRLRLTVCAPDGTVLAVYTEEATGDASSFPVTKRADAHDFAIKTAESQALKRCAINLGDQFGLSLYRKGSTDAVVLGTLVGLPPREDRIKDAAPPGSVDEHAPDVVPEQDPEKPAPAGETPATDGSDEPGVFDQLLARGERAGDTEALNRVWRDGKAAQTGGHITPAEWEDVKTLLTARARDLDNPTGDTP